MKQPISSPHASSGARWQLLGELELPVSSTADQAIAAWLTETISPLRLYADFLNKILKSAHDAVMRALHSENASQRRERIHLFVFAPADRSFYEEQTWGFFRIEKTANALADQRIPAQAIEFYLYMERKTKFQ